MSTAEAHVVDRMWGVHRSTSRLLVVNISLLGVPPPKLQGLTAYAEQVWVIDTIGFVEMSKTIVVVLPISMPVDAPLLPEHLESLDDLLW